MEMEEMPKTYDPAATEPQVLEKWLAGGYYQRKPEKRPGAGDCTVVIPPPNVTGKLHMGHALDDSIQDAIVRQARMRGLHALDLRHRPCRHRHADQGGQEAQGRRQESP